MLASCGGGGGSGGGSVVVNPAPTPTPGPIPTPTPTPTPGPGTLNTGEVKPAADATFIAATMELVTTGGASQTNGVITGGATNSRLTTLDTPQFSGSYNNGYRLADAINSVQFWPEHLTRDDTSPNGNGTVLFTKITGEIHDYLALYQQTTYSSSSKGSGYTMARYGGSAGWQHTIVEGSARRSRLNYLAYGTATAPGAMPRSGVVKFSLLGSGNYATDTDLWFLSSGTSNFLTVDFGTGVVSGQLGLGGQNFYKNVVGGIGYIRIEGSLSGNSMTGALADSSLGAYSGIPGQFRLMFVGPSANEVVLTYVVNSGTQAAVGAAVGVIDPYAL
ncbi:hypothetical protein [Sphingomonas gei]|nr:hypothetical protein [Sphingomonas gei]